MERDNRLNKREKTNYANQNDIFDYSKRTVYVDVSKPSTRESAYNR